ncbi:MAG: hypothetical protein ACT4OJ_12300 [Bacteroidota bacterium]
MEVHAHTHTARKKWTHYFWEFLMLFLAVFCGFLAEYQLEHTIENQRAKQFAISLYEDIKLDTGAVKFKMWETDFASSRIDTFVNLVQEHDPKELPGGTWYYYGRFATRYISVTLQDATINQLKNSGALRYFRDHLIANAIARYDQACRNLESEIKKQDLIYADLFRWRNQLFNTFYMNDVMNFDIPYEKIDSFKRKDILLLSFNKQDFIQYANVCQLKVYNNGFIFGLCKNVFEKGEKLLALLKKGYHLK